MGTICDYACGFQFAAQTHKTNKIRMSESKFYVSTFSKLNGTTQGASGGGEDVDMDEISEEESCTAESSSEESYEGSSSEESGA